MWLGRATDIRENEIQQQNLNKNHCVISGVEWKRTSKGALLPSGSMHLCEGTFSVSMSNKAKYQRK